MSCLQMSDYSFYCAMLHSSVAMQVICLSVTMIT